MIESDRQDQEDEITVLRSILNQDDGDPEVDVQDQEEDRPFKFLPNPEGSKNSGLDPVSSVLNVFAH